MKHQHDEADDDQLAPMVDGLSGALCLLILVTTIFMVSATDTVVNHLMGYKLNFEDSVYEKSKNIIYFNAGISLSHLDLYDVRQKIREMKNPTIYVYIPEGIKNRNEKMIFNFISMKENLNVDIPIKFKKGDASVCGVNNSCIYWKES